MCQHFSVCVCLCKETGVLSHNSSWLVNLQHQCGGSLQLLAVIFLETMSQMSWNTCLLFVCVCWREKEGNVLFNDALNTFYFRLYGTGHMMSQMSWNIWLLFCHEKHVCYLSVYVGGRRKEMFYLMTNSTHFIYSYMASDVW